MNKSIFDLSPELEEKMTKILTLYEESQKRRAVREASEKDNKTWSEHQELRDVATTMDNIVERAKATREILRQQNNENYTQSKHE